MESGAMSNLLARLVLLATALALPSAGWLWPAKGHQGPQTDSTLILGATDEILRQVSQLRGLAVLHPVEAGFQSRAEIERSLIQDMNERTTPEEFEAQAEALRLLGLIPKDFPLRDFLLRLLTEQVAGYYRPKTKRLYLADWLTLDEQKTVLVHELMHALQDQHFNLERFETSRPGQGDQDLAIHALVEGEAMVVTLNYLLQPRQLDLTRLPAPLSDVLEQIWSHTNEGGSEMLQSAPAVVRESLLFPYIYGTRFVFYLLRHGSWNRVSEAYQSLPDSTEQILHPDRFLARDEPVKITLPPLERTLGHGWRRRLVEVNGEFGYFLILSPYLESELAEEAAAGWDGDQLVLYEEVRNGRLLLAHRSLWDSVAEAQEFARAYVQRLERRYAELDAVIQKRKAVRVWRTSDGVAYLERRGREVLVIETRGTLALATLSNAARALWNRRP